MSKGKVKLKNNKLKEPNKTPNIEEDKTDTANTANTANTTKPDTSKADEDKIHKERLRVIDIIFDLYPELKKNKEEITMNVFEKYGRPIKYILTQYIHNNNVYYIDPDGMILDKDINFKGLYTDNMFYFYEDNFIDKLEHYDRLMDRRDTK